jgi:hypothetical protein
MRRGLPPVLAAFLAAFLAVSLGAQVPQAPSVVVRARVVDSANVPIAGAEVSVLEGLKDVRATGLTDAAGRITLIIMRGEGQRELVARKIGLARSGTFFRPQRDTVSLQIAMHRVVQALEAVKVNAREDVKRKSYHVDADEIANSERLIIDGMDVLTKLKPDILFGRMPGCGVQNVWVNGKLIRYPLPNAMVQARRGLTPSPKMKPSSGRPPPVPRLQNASEDVLTVVASIHPEHIEEMTYLDCFDNSMNHTRGSSALYVVLKEGIGFEMDGKGSYVKDLKELPFLPPDSTPVLPDLSYRRRLLGIFDELTGKPVAGASVTDVLTGTTAMTTVTGTVSLGFLPEGSSSIRIAKPGYAELKLDVAISPRDTMPITLILSKPK